MSEVNEKTKPLGRAVLWVTRELLVQLCEGLQHQNGVKRYFKVVENPLPEGCKIVRVYYNCLYDDVQIVLEHERFQPDNGHSPYQTLPSPKMQVVYVEDEG